MKSFNNLFLTMLGLFAIVMAIAVPTATAAVDIPFTWPTNLESRYVECAFDGTVRETCVKGKLQTSFEIRFNGAKYTTIIEPGKAYFQGLNFLWYPPVPADHRGNMYFGAPTCQFWENNNRPTPPAVCGSCTRTWWTGEPLNCGDARDDARSRGHDMSCDYMCG